MTSWLDYLETAGGKIFILLVMLFGILVMAGIMHIMGRDPAERGILIESNLVTATFTTLLGKLGDKKPNGN